jgi:hypothetical protein
MTVYEELEQAAGNYDRRSLDLENKITQSFIKILEAFAKYCTIPDVGRFLKFSKWDGRDSINGQRHYESTHTVFAAIRFDPKDGFWRIGVHLVLSKNTVPARAAFFTLALIERSGKIIVLSPPNGDEMVLDTDDPTQLESFAASLSASIRGVFDAHPLGYLQQNSAKKSIGFHVRVDPPASVQRLEVDI